jgi:hypothetical protein
MAAMHGAPQIMHATVVHRREKGLVALERECHLISVTNREEYLLRESSFQVSQLCPEIPRALEQASKLPSLHELQLSSQP